MRKPFLLSAILLLSNYTLPAQRELKNPLINSKEVIANAVALHDKGKYKEAITEYLKVPISDTNYSQALNELALSYYSDSNYVAAENCIQSGLELFPEKKATWFRLLADIYDDTKHISEALNMYDSILKMNPYDYLSYFNKGICFYRQERYDEALLCFQKCVTLNPYYSSGHYFLGVISMLKGNMVQAMLSFTTDLLVMPGNRYMQKSVSFLSSIATVNTTVIDLLKKYKPGKEDDFEQLQDIILNKIALDKKYKLKVDLEDQVVRQIQVMMEKLEYNEQDKGFWMQYYVPMFKKVWDDK
ncbi:MAG: tetratricopeptide repeat protein, partial [Ferruginibacter sp.]